MSGAPIRPKRSSAKATADKINASLKAEGAKIGEQRTEPPPHCYAGSQDALQNAKKRLKQIKICQIKNIYFQRRWVRRSSLKNSACSAD